MKEEEELQRWRELFRTHKEKKKYARRKTQKKIDGGESEREIYMSELER